MLSRPCEDRVLLPISGRAAKACHPTLHTISPAEPRNAAGSPGIALLLRFLRGLLCFHRGVAPLLVVGLCVVDVDQPTHRVVSAATQLGTGQLPDLLLVHVPLAG